MSGPLFNEESLRRAVVGVWGTAGAHVDVLDVLMMQAKQARHLEADLIRAERAVVLLRNLVETQDGVAECVRGWVDETGQRSRLAARRSAMSAAKRYLADLDSGDIADGMV